MTTLSSTEIAKLAGLSYRQLDYLTRSGLPIVKDATPGSGVRRRWSEGDAVVLSACRALLACGATVKVAAVAAAALAALPAPSWDDGFVFVSATGEVGETGAGRAESGWWLDLALIAENVHHVEAGTVDQ